MATDQQDFRLPADAQPGDCVLAHCPVCNQLIYVLVIPGGDQYVGQVVAQMVDAMEAHVMLTGHDAQARREAKGKRGDSGDKR